jgi:hypothetical protein
MDFTTAYTREYEDRRDRFRESFPAAHRFLKAVETLCVDDPRFHLGVDKNVHFYVEDSFLAYMTMEKVKTATPHLVFSPNPHAVTKPGTTLQSELVFARELTQIIMNLRGFHTWAAKHKTKPTDFIIRSTTPDAFFDALLVLLKKIADRIAPLPPPTPQ